MILEREVEQVRRIVYEDTLPYSGIRKVKLEIDLGIELEGYKSAFETILRVATFCEENIKELFGEGDE